MAWVQGLMGPSLSLSIRNLVWPSSSRGAGERELNSDRRGAQEGGRWWHPSPCPGAGGWRKAAQPEVLYTARSPVCLPCLSADTRREKRGAGLPFAVRMVPRVALLCPFRRRWRKGRGLRPHGRSLDPARHHTPSDPSN